MKEKLNSLEKTNVLISVCIPLYQTEQFLAQCLRSVLMQDFNNFEVVIVSDASDGKDEKGHSAKKIIRLVKKETDKERMRRGLLPVSLRFIEHHENRGLIEVRRTLVYEARGLYVTQCDSDDEMEAGALKALYKVATESGVDIVHGTSTAGVFLSDGSFSPTKENRYGKIYYGRIDGRDIFHQWIIKGAFTANTWGKLIKRDLFLKSYELIPYTECNMADDLLLFFFLSQFAKSYIGIQTKVYRYRVNTGMSSGRKISSLKRWKMICSTASVFNVLSTWIQSPENKDALKPDEVESVRTMTRYYLINNIKQMNEVVVPELQSQAYEMLCDYWGKSFVDHTIQAFPVSE